MTSHPRDASHKLFDTIAKYPKICKQFHLPFQSGNDRVLKAMNRHYDSAQYLSLVEYGHNQNQEHRFLLNILTVLVDCDI